MIMVLCISAFSFAQTTDPHMHLLPIDKQMRNAQLRVAHSSARFGPHQIPTSTQDIYLDYSYCQDTMYGTAISTPGPGYRWPYIFDVNSTYTSLDSSTQMVAASFDSIVDSYNATAPVGISMASFSTIRVDSIFLFLGHKNTSGLNDTIIVQVCKLSATNVPNGLVLSSDTVITAVGLSPGNDWFTNFVHTVVLPGNGLIIPGAKKFGVRLLYKGAIQDTLGIIAGLYDQGGPCGQSQYLPIKSDFYPWSFRAISQYVATYPLIPSTVDFFTDCNGNGTLEAGDGASPFQDALIWTAVTLDPLGVTSISNEKLTLFQNTPNPATDLVNIKYNLKSNAPVSFVITDVTGKTMMTESLGNKMAGTNTYTVNTSSLSAGVYFYTIQAGGFNATRKMTIIR